MATKKKTASAKKGPTKKAATKKAVATTIEAFLASLPAARRAEIERLHRMVTEAVPQFAPKVSSGMLVYGSYEYRYATGRTGTSARIAIASRAAAISIYVTAVDEGGWLAEQLGKQLGKVSVGKSCIGVKRVDDLVEPVFRDLLVRAAKLRAPGEVP